MVLPRIFEMRTVTVRYQRFDVGTHLVETQIPAHGALDGRKVLGGRGMRKGRSCLRRWRSHLKDSWGWQVGGWSDPITTAKPWLS